jgi:hypothetical protein
MRTYGRVALNPLYPDVLTWVQVDTDSNGFNDLVYLTTLAQVLKLNLGESPFYGNFGIPAKSSVITQIYPDYYVTFTQQQFTQYFTSLIISRSVVTNSKGQDMPVYAVNVVTQYGSKIPFQVPV